MSSLPEHAYRLEGISPKAYEHPADRAATAALASIPHLDTVVRKISELGYERALRTSMLGSSVKLGPDQLPDVHAEHRRAYETLDMEPLPDLYLTQHPIANALTIGAGRPIVVVQSGLVGLLDASGLRAVFAHEAAHTLSDHNLYRTALVIMLRLSAGTRLPLGVLPVGAVLLEWSRAGELTCDRAAALVTRDPESVCRVLMAVAAGSQAERLNLDAFMRQGMEYREGAKGLERLSRLLLDIGVTHPMPVRRIHELMSWVRSGEYDRIVAGDYRRRSEPVEPFAEAGDAVNHYAERFRGAFAEAGQSVAEAGQQLGEWLRRRARERVSGDEEPQEGSPHDGAADAHGAGAGD
ncbi:MAG: M48 family metallopeptidase [Acidobacteriota bacterium]|nr:M48 family metallopeptidase [Acidobacteriota bacterium]